MLLQDLARVTPVQADDLKTEDPEAEKERCSRPRLRLVAAVQRPGRVKAETCGEQRRSHGAVEQEAAGELLDRGEEDIIPLHITMTEVLHGMDLAEAELQVEAVEEEGLPEDLEAEHQEVQEVELQAVPEVVLQEVLEEEHLRTGEEVTGGRPEDIMEMLLRCMMSEHVYIVSSCNCYNYISSK